MEPSPEAAHEAPPSEAHEVGIASPEPSGEASSSTWSGSALALAWLFGALSLVLVPCSIRLIGAGLSHENLGWSALLLVPAQLGLSLVGLVLGGLLSTARIGSASDLAWVRRAVGAVLALALAGSLALLNVRASGC